MSHQKWILSVSLFFPLSLSTARKGRCACADRDEKIRYEPAEKSEITLRLNGYMFRVYTRGSRSRFSTDKRLQFVPLLSFSSSSSYSFDMSFYNNRLFFFSRTRANTQLISTPINEQSNAVEGKSIDLKAKGQTIHIRKQKEKKKAQ